MKQRRTYAKDILEAAERLEMSPATISKRIYNLHWPRELALTFPRKSNAGDYGAASPKRVRILREPDELTYVIDTGRRRAYPCSPRDGIHAAYQHALVYFDGEKAPRWVDAKRLDPAEHGPPPARPPMGERTWGPRVGR